MVGDYVLTPWGEMDLITKRRGTDIDNKFRATRRGEHIPTGGTSGKFSKFGEWDME